MYAEHEVTDENETVDLQVWDVGGPMGKSHTSNRYEYCAVITRSAGMAAVLLRRAI